MPVSWGCVADAAAAARLAAERVGNAPGAAAAWGAVTRGSAKRLSCRRTQAYSSRALASAPAPLPCLRGVR